MTIYRNHSRYHLTAAWGGCRLPRVLDPLWRRLARRPRVLRYGRR